MVLELLIVPWSIFPYSLLKIEFTFDALWLWLFENFDKLLSFGVPTLITYKTLHLLEIEILELLKPVL